MVDHQNLRQERMIVHQGALVALALISNHTKLLDSTKTFALASMETIGDVLTHVASEEETEESGIVCLYTQ